MEAPGSPPGSAPAGSEPPSPAKEMLGLAHLRRFGSEASLESNPTLLSPRPIKVVTRLASAESAENNVAERSPSSKDLRLPPRRRQRQMPAVTARAWSCDRTEQTRCRITRPASSPDAEAQARERRRRPRCGPCWTWWRSSRCPLTKEFDRGQAYRLTRIEKNA